MNLDRLVEVVEHVVERAATLTPAQLSSEVLDHVGLVFADTVGVMTAGARSPELVALAGDPAAGLSDRQAPGLARALVPRRYGQPVDVAWLNGTAGTFLELDEGFRPTGHPGIHVIPAALAVAESTRTSGTELAVAIAAGYEVAARLFESFTLPRTMHPHGHFGAIGAATAVAMLRGTDAVALARLAATQPLLTGWEACYAGATARNTWAGHANRSGVIADALHRAGFTGSMASHLSVVAPYLTAETTLTEPVRGETLRIRRNYFKFHSACALNHSALDAVLEAWHQLEVRDPKAVRRIEVVTVTANLRIDRPAAPNALSTRFSLPYAIATAVLNGSTGPASFAWDPDVAEYAKRVTVRADPAMDAYWPRKAPARVLIETEHETCQATVDNPLGHHSRPVSAAELRHKFVSLLTEPSSPMAIRLGACFDTLANLRGIDDCSRMPLPADLSRFWSEV